MSVDDRIQNLRRIVGPYRESKMRGIFADKVIESWFDKMIFRQADVHVRDLIRSGDYLGRRQFLQELRRINPRVYVRILARPKILWSRLKYTVWEPRA